MQLISNLFLLFIFLAKVSYGVDQYSAPRSPAMNNEALSRVQLDQVEEMKQELRQLRGEVEQLQFENSQLKDKFNRFASDAEIRFNELKAQDEVKPELKHDTKNKPEAKNDSSTSAPKEDSIFDKVEQPQTKKETKPEVKNQDKHINKTENKSEAKTEEETKKSNKTAQGKELIKQQYQEAYDLFKNKEYKEAQTAFQKFINEHPKSEFTGKAYYWHAESSYLLNQYEKSATSALKSYQVDTSGLHASDSLVRLARSMAKLKRNKEACTVYAKLQNEFPNLNSSTKKSVEEEIAELKCKS